MANNITGWTLSDTAVNTFIPVPNSGNSAWYVPNCKGNANNIITATGPGTAFVYLVCLQYSGCDLISPLDTAAFTTGVSGNPASPNISTQFPNEVLVGFIQSSDSNATAGAGWTDVTHPGAAPELVEERVVVSIQTNVNATATESASTNWACGIIAFVGAGQRPVTTPTYAGGAPMLDTILPVLRARIRIAMAQKAKNKK
jgi:hypothetical protein